MCDECEIIIDNRERDLLLYYKENVDSNKYYSKYKNKNLDLGDIIYKINNKIVLIIERKTLDDLHKSIKAPDPITMIFSYSFDDSDKLEANIRLDSYFLNILRSKSK